MEEIRDAWRSLVKSPVDYVIGVDVTDAHYPDKDPARRKLHVACTRAIEQLWLLSVGRASPILPG